MNNLQHFQHKSELTTKQFKIATFISVAIERTGADVNDITDMVKDIETEFPKLLEEDFKIAFRNGGLGKYGKTYKLTTQEVCYWIREYLKEISPNQKTKIIDGKEYSKDFQHPKERIAI